MNHHLITTEGDLAVLLRKVFNISSPLVSINKCESCRRRILAGCVMSLLVGTRSLHK